MRVFLALLLTIFSMENIASNLPDFPFVTVTGESVRKVTPDKVTLGFYVITFNKEAANAQKTLYQSSSMVVSVLKKHKVPIENITSFEVNKRAKRARDKNYNDLDILGYEFRQRFEVIMDDISQYSEMTNELLNINNVEDIESRFDSSTREEVEIDLIKDAAQKAKHKAEQMSAGLGVELGGVFAFNDSGSFSSFFATFGLKDDSRAYAMMSGSSLATNLFLPQYIEIRKSINVVYKLNN